MSLWKIIVIPNPLLLAVYLHYKITLFFPILNSDNGKQIYFEDKFLILQTNRHWYFFPQVHSWQLKRQPRYVHNKHIDNQRDTKLSCSWEWTSEPPHFSPNIRTSSLFKIKIIFLLYNMQHIWHNLNMFSSENCSH